MLLIICPLCHQAELQRASWEAISPAIELGVATRYSLVCPKCKKEFLLQFTLGHVIER